VRVYVKTLMKEISCFRSLPLQPLLLPLLQANHRSPILTQSSLASHLDKVRVLEGILAEQEVTKREVRTLREMMQEKEQRKVGQERQLLIVELWQW